VSAIAKEPNGQTLRTKRLILRQWDDGDRRPFAELNADPAVMEFFPATLDRAQSDAFVERIATHIREQGWGLWAVEVVDGPRFVGFVGLWPAGVDIFEGRPVVEIGWRLARGAWGMGYATEAARTALRYGFDTVGLDEIVSFTAALNVRSRAVMERIGMTHDPADDFEHPRLAPRHRLRPHVLYRIRSTGSMQSVG
jgi:RimJ/RimL family protein N-acetyltransferase